MAWTTPTCACACLYLLVCYYILQPVCIPCTCLQEHAWSPWVPHFPLPSDLPAFLLCLTGGRNFVCLPCRGHSADMDCHTYPDMPTFSLSCPIYYKPPSLGGCAVSLTFLVTLPPLPSALPWETWSLLPVPVPLSFMCAFCLSHVPGWAASHCLFCLSLPCRTACGGRCVLPSWACASVYS
jgi:hypothetical protein